MDGVNEFSLQNSRLGGGVSEWAQVAAYVRCPGLLNMADISSRGLASTTSFICLAEGSRRDMYIIQGPITSEMDYIQQKLSCHAFKLFNVEEYRCHI